MRRTLILVAAVCVAITACSSSHHDAASTATSSTSTSSTSTAPSETSTPVTPSTSPTTKLAPTGCSSPKVTVPSGATVGTIPDVDGDGRDDRDWVRLTGASAEFGIATAAGGGGSASAEFASGAPRSMFVTDPAAAGRVYVVAGDGRVDDLYVFAGCHLDPVVDRKGKPYTFDLGFVGNGTGVGCASVDGKPSLLGLNALSTEGSKTPWTRTVIAVQGNVAHNGVEQSGTFTEPQDHDAIGLLHTVSCGDRTISDDGVSVG